MSNKKPRMDDKQDKQFEQMDKFFSERPTVPFANTIEEFFENPTGLALRNPNTTGHIEVCVVH
jgi:hypothetical protein